MPKKDETALVVPEETNRSLIQAPKDPYADIEFADDGVDESRVRLQWPDIRLIQGTTKGIEDSDRHLGMFYHPDRAEFTETLDVIPLAVRYTRAFFEEDAMSPACVSLDGRAPEPNQLLWTKQQVLVKNQGLRDIGFMPQPTSCDACPFSAWGDDNTPPPCGESRLLMVMREDGSFARFRASSTAIAPVDRTINRLINGAKRLPIFAHMWSFGSQKTEKGSKKWYQLTVNTRPLDIDEVKEVNETVKMIRGQVDTVTRETVNEAGSSEADIIDVEYE